MDEIIGLTISRHRGKFSGLAGIKRLRNSYVMEAQPVLYN
jgi:hypothetical protein